MFIRAMGRPTLIGSYGRQVTAQDKGSLAEPARAMARAWIGRRNELMGGGSGGPAEGLVWWGGWLESTGSGCSFGVMEDDEARGIVKRTGDNVQLGGELERGRGHHLPRRWGKC